MSLKEWAKTELDKAAHEAVEGLLAAAKKAVDMLPEPQADSELVRRYRKIENRIRKPDTTSGELNAACREQEGIWNQMTTAERQLALIDHKHLPETESDALNEYRWREKLLYSALRDPGCTSDRLAGLEQRQAKNWRRLNTAEQAQIVAEKAKAPLSPDKDLEFQLRNKDQQIAELVRLLEHALPLIKNPNDRPRTTAALPAAFAAAIRKHKK